MADAYVFVVDSDATARHTLIRVLESAGLRVVTYPSAEAFLRAPLRKEPFCLILDINLPGLSGLELQQALAKTSFQMPIIFLTGYATIPISVRAMQAGAADFLTKPVHDETLLGAVHKALEQAQQAWRERVERTALQQRLVTLTPREHDVLARVVAGMLNKQIAFDLGIAEKTVKVHRARVMQKMQANSLPDLVRLADQVGIHPQNM